MNADELLGHFVENFSEGASGAMMNADAASALAEAIATRLGAVPMQSREILVLAPSGSEIVGIATKEILRKFQAQTPVLSSLLALWQQRVSTGGQDPRLPAATEEVRRWIASMVSTLSLLRTYVEEQTDSAALRSKLENPDK